jgi:hypothetical protein
MRILTTLVLAALVAGSGHGRIAALDVSSLQVHVEGGVLSGTVTPDGQVRRFFGVPYAAPPVGGLRWRAPEPAAPWTGVRNASAFSAECMQNIVAERKPWTEEFMAHGATSEDCLSLNGWTAAASASEQRPVYVWLHGGGLVEGSGSIATFDGESLARKGLVVATVNWARRVRIRPSDRGIASSRIGQLRLSRSGRGITSGCDGTSRHSAATSASPSAGSPLARDQSMRWWRRRWRKAVRAGIAEAGRA